MIYTNKTDIPLGLAVWLVADDYDYSSEEKYISATSLLRPIKQLVLTRRIDLSTSSVDLSDLVARSMGTGLHDSIEKAWKRHYKTSLKALGYGDDLISKIKINPTKEELKPDDVPIYLEQRAVKELNGWKIGGKFDLVMDGMLNDYKSTSVYTYINSSKDEDYCQQGSIYRWLNPDKIQSDFIRINFIFTDWSSASSKSDPNYPKSKIAYKDIPLMNQQETEKFISAKLKQLEMYMDAPEEAIPRCTDEELWRGPTKFKYFANKDKTTGRSTKNFDSQAEANKYWLTERGGKGIVLAFLGLPKRCIYCQAASICKQKKEMFGE